MYFIKCVVKLAVFMNKIYQLVYQNLNACMKTKNISVQHRYIVGVFHCIQKTSACLLNFVFTEKKKSAIQYTIFVFNKIMDFSSNTCDAAWCSSSVRPYLLHLPLLDPS
jgi:hypothetical protein